jgi:hypothetical protein
MTPHGLRWPCPRGVGFRSQRYYNMIRPSFDGSDRYLDSPKIRSSNSWRARRNSCSALASRQNLSSSTNGLHANSQVGKRATGPGRLNDPAWSLKDNVPIGGLGIQFHTRRRNRVNGVVKIDRSGSGFTLRVNQSFGNCAQYIQARRPVSGDQSYEALAT